MIIIKDQALNCCNINLFYHFDGSAYSSLSYIIYRIIFFHSILVISELFTHILWSKISLHVEAKIKNWTRYLALFVVSYSCECYKCYKFPPKCTNTCKLVKRVRMIAYQNKALFPKRQTPNGWYWKMLSDASPSRGFKEQKATVSLEK